MHVRCLNNLAAAFLKVTNACMCMYLFIQMMWVDFVLVEYIVSPFSSCSHLQVEMYKESQGACQKVLEKEPNNVKALFRYGKVCTKFLLSAV